jgi:glycosyltransferase 2 family protein
MRKKISLFFRYGIFLILGLVLAWLSVRGLLRYWGGIKSSLAHERYFLIVPILLLYLLSHWSRAVRWKIMMEPLGYDPPTLPVMFSVIVGYLVNLAFPRLGEVMRCTLLGRHEKIPIEQLLGTILVERVVDILCLLMVFGLTYVVQAKEISDYVVSLLHGGSSGGHVFGLWGLLAVGLLGVGTIFIYRRYKEHKVVLFVSRIVLGLWAGVARIRYMKKKGWFIFHSILLWTIYFLCTRLGMLMFRELDGLGITQTLSVLSVGSIAVIITPGGLGAYPVMIQKTLMFYQVGPGIALACGMMLWVLPTVLVILGGVVGLVGLAGEGKEKKMEKVYGKGVVGAS